ncbi:MAG: DUF1489 domain-containing protein [Rhodobacteraceae bacterium]|nr:DUF1489 domain-containing protein [Paracoccaceae bacterium]
MNKPLHLIKLCVGIDSVEALAAWQAQRASEQPGWHPTHVTRMWPRRAEEVLAGGSLYWVIRGNVLARQRILALEPREGADGVRRCAIRLEPQLVLTRTAPRRPFQGWRYLEAADAPPDLGPARGDEAPLPPALQSALADIGVL